MSDTPWYEGVDQETLGVMQNRGLVDKSPAEAVANLAKAYRELEKFRGAPAERLLTLPKDLSDEAGWKALWSRLGVPAEAKDYELPGVEDQGLADVLRQAAHASNALPSTASEIAKALSGHLAEQAKAKADNELAEIANQDDELKKLWGAPNIVANTLIAKNFAERFPQFKEGTAALEKVVGKAAIMNMFYEMGKMSGEDKGIADSTMTNGPLTAEQAKLQLDDLMTDRTWVDKVMVQREAAAVRKFNELTKIISGFI